MRSAGFHLALSILIAAAPMGCRKEEMGDQLRKDPMESSTLFQDGESARPLVAGTVPRGGETVRDEVYGQVAMPATQAANTFPWQLTSTDLERGRERYDIYCSVCHGRLGDGEGMIVQRGFIHPPSFFLDRLRAAPHGYFYNVITDGKGAMFAYNDRVAPEDRWRIVGYIRALQAARPNDNGLSTTPAGQVK